MEPDFYSFCLQVNKLLFSWQWPTRLPWAEPTVSSLGTPESQHALDSSSPEPTPPPSQQTLIAL